MKTGGISPGSGLKRPGEPVAGVESPVSGNRRQSSPTTEEVERYISDHEYATQAELAREFRVSRSVIRNRLKHVRNYKRRADRRAEYFAKLKEFIEANPDLTVAEIAEKRDEHPAALKDYVGRHGNALGYSKKKPSDSRIYETKVTAEEVESAIADNEWANNEELAVILSKPISREAFDAASLDADSVFEKLIKKGWAERVGRDRIRLIKYLKKIETDIVDLVADETARILSVLRSSQVSKSTISALTRNMTTYRRKIPKGGPPLKVTEAEVAAFWKRTGTTQFDIAHHFGVDQSLISRKLSALPEYVASQRLKLAAEDVANFVKENPEATHNDIARHFSVHPKTVGSKLREVPFYRRKRGGRGLKITADDVADFVRASPEASQAGIASHFGISLTTVANRLKNVPFYKRKASLSKVTTEELGAFVELHPELNQAEIAAHFDIGLTTVSRRLKDVPFYKNKSSLPKVTVEDIGAFVKLHPDATQVEIAARFDVNPSTVAKRIKDVPFYQRKHSTGAGLPLDRIFSLDRELRVHRIITKKVDGLLQRFKTGDKSALTEILYVYGWLARESAAKLLSPENDMYDDLLAEAALQLIELVQEYLGGQSGDGIDLEVYIRSGLSQRLKKELRKQGFRWGRRSLGQPEHDGDSVSNVGLLVDSRSPSEDDLVNKIDQLWFESV